MYSSCNSNLINGFHLEPPRLFFSVCRLFHGRFRCGMLGQFVGRILAVCVNCHLLGEFMLLSSVDEVIVLKSLRTQV